MRVLDDCEECGDEHDLDGEVWVCRSCWEKRCDECERGDCESCERRNCSSCDIVEECSGRYEDDPPCDLVKDLRAEVESLKEQLKAADPLYEIRKDVDEKELS